MYSSGRDRIQWRKLAKVRTCSSIPMSPKPTLSITAHTPAERYRCSCGRKDVSCGRATGIQPWLSQTMLWRSKDAALSPVNSGAGFMQNEP
jgi:hypothetical protein